MAHIFTDGCHIPSFYVLTHYLTAKQTDIKNSTFKEIEVAVKDYQQLAKELYQKQWKEMFDRNMNINSLDSWRKRI